MAKGSSGNSVMRGKRGNSVYYKLTNSNNKETQGERAYVGKVANPKTLQQAIQRVKLAPAVAFYRAFKDEILDHSFEGVKYGGRSHARFMKLAMNLQSGYPFVVKGEGILAPGNYVMSEGSLAGIPFDLQSKTSIYVPSIAVEDGDTLADFSKLLIGQCPWIHNGDQITFAFILGGEVVAPYAYVHRLVLDTESTTPVIDVLGNVTIDQDSNVGVLFSASAEPIVGAAIIVSRPSVSNTNGAVSWQRSRSSFVVNTKNTAIVSEFFTQAKYEAAVGSYMTASREVSSSWYLNQGKLKASQQAIPDAPLDFDVKLVNVQILNEDSTLHGKYIAAIQDKQGRVKVIGGNGSTYCYFGVFGNQPADQAPVDFSTVKQYWTQTASNINTLINSNLPAGHAPFEIISFADAEALAVGDGITANWVPATEPQNP